MIRKEELNFDYGKFDFVINDNQTILLDANKTPGSFSLNHETARKLALEINDFF